MQSGLEEITEAELHQMFIDSRLLDVHKCIPVRVESYSASAQTVEVTPMVNRMIPDGAVPPNYVSEPLPKLSDVPVAHMRGGGFFVAMPCRQGDFGFVLFCDRNIAAYRATGNQSDPGDLGMHTMSSALFVPAVFPDEQVLAHADANNMVMGSDTVDAARIVIKPSGEIDLGAAAASFIARADKVISHLNAIASLLSTCTPAASETGLASIKTSAASLVLAGFADVATDNVKVD